ncbi:aldehyde dehydrogenase (acceptor) [Thermaerobacter marianensis DSM 12885]|uniref:Aldehyde dehydrogenase (Acceptor) n=1 Tax=Thermaerobacter marianensis (strain ATCC 700841 / DSM 12885 / JCM 10246 / 7p75a) TaxID=644966 RepID=E6SGH2_THEM7|nr:aldehyde dehydrogenase family protein [Thermaerobacter marianensis]ADU51624.1 aldehyde dehydrogenase (acceptor) [Thermaerobacter marianensis DSM 12885]
MTVWDEGGAVPPGGGTAAEAAPAAEPTAAGAAAAGKAVEAAAGPGTGGPGSPLTRTRTLKLPFVAPVVRQWLGSRKLLFIGGRWQEPRSGRYLVVTDPATGEPLAEVAEAGEEDVDLAVKAARRALEGTWGKLPPAERGRLLWKLADLLEENAQEFAQLESLNTGKPVTETTMADVPLAVEHFRYFAGWATKWTGETLPASFPGEYLAYTRREPVGVVGAIVPWNFPLMIASWKLAPALATGNTVVLKPSELTPLTALRLAELVRQAGFPPGTVNVVPGYGEPAGRALVDHPGVDKISFTGSPGVGRKIMTAAARDFKRVTLELGGKSPNIVFPDADLDNAVAGAMMGIFFNQGEVCCAGSRLFVHKEHFDRIVQDIADRASRLRQGPGIHPMTQMGPLISRSHLERVLSYIERGREEGAELLVGGEPNSEAGPGYFVKPTVFVGRDDMTIAREEIFGPVLTVLPFESLDEVVRRANDTPYGLAAGIWTRDVAKAIKVAHRLKAGTVWINGYNLLDATSPWGGFKQSGIGREMGRYALEHYTEVKSVWVNLG